MIWTEWDKLQEIIVGDVYDPKDFLEHAKSVGQSDNEFLEGMHRILEESREDLQKLSTVLQSYGVTVHRPKKLKPRLEQSRMWRSVQPYPAICPRDMHIAYGNNILSTIGGDCSRFNEADFFSQIMLQKHSQGRNYISMPRPLLDDTYKDYQELEGQILYHSANMLKCGDAMIYTIPYGDNRQGRGTWTGLEWIKRNIGYDITWMEMKRSGHADGRIALVKPGVLMARYPEFIPEQLKNWTVIPVSKKSFSEQFSQMRSQTYYQEKVKTWLRDWVGYVDETVFDLNVLSIDDKTVITNGYDKQTAEQLKQYGIELIPFDFRHRFFFDSGLHCVTLDLAREGERESYLYGYKGIR